MVELIKNTVNNNSKVVNTLQKTIYSTTFRNQTPLILETSLTLALNVSEMVFHMSEFPCVCVCGGGGGGGFCSVKQCSTKFKNYFESHVL